MVWLREVCGLYLRATGHRPPPLGCIPQPVDALLELGSKVPTHGSVLPKIGLRPKRTLEVYFLLDLVIYRTPGGQPVDNLPYSGVLGLCVRCFYGLTWRPDEDPNLVFLKRDGLFLRGAAEGGSGHRFLSRSNCRTTGVTQDSWCGQLVYM